MTNAPQRQTVYRPSKGFHATASAAPAPLPPLFAKHPFPHIVSAFGEFNALVFAANQEPNHPEIHQGDFAQYPEFFVRCNHLLPIEGWR